MVLLHCDLISDTFYTAAHVGVIPYLTWSDAKKRQRADEKKRKKDEHRRREKEGTEAQRPSGTTDERKNESAEHGRSPEAAATTATGAPQ